MKIIIGLLIRTSSILVASYIIPGVTLDNYKTAIVVAIVLGALNTFVRPIIAILTFPITIVTLGLFYFVINILMIYATVWIVPGFGIGSLVSAILFSVTISLINSFLSKLS